MEIPEYHNALIPFDYEKVQQDSSVGRGDFLTDLWNREDFINRDEISPSLYNYLRDIEQKLNLIIRHLSSQGRGEPVIPMEKEVWIGPDGIRFDAEEELAAGDILKVRILLPLYPMAYLSFLSEVTMVLRLGNGRYEVYIDYSSLSADDKDRIITYLFKRQREAIREDKQR